MKSRTHRLNRRTFLKGALVAGGAAAGVGGVMPFARLANAQGHNPDAPDRYYIFCYFPGGWDILLSLDPRDPARFTNGNVRTTQIQPGYDQLANTDGMLVEAGGLTFGPYIGDLANHISDLCVIRGMSMDTLTHEVGRRRFLTGMPPSGLQARGSSGATWLASHFGGGEAIPNLSVQVESYNKGLPNYAAALRVNSVTDLLRALEASPPMVGSMVQRQVGLRLHEAAYCGRGKASPLWSAAEASRKKAAEMVTGGVSGAFQFRSNSVAMQDLRAHYEFEPYRTNTPEVQAAIAVQAITTGISRCVSVAISEGLDTHFDDWATDQGPRQARGFRAISKMVQDLKQRTHPVSGESWFSHTTIVGFSEFSRTALLNSRGGRDHALTNACFLLGGGVQGGQVIGASSDVGMQPTTTNLATGQTDPEGEVIRPEHVLQTLFDEVGIGQAPDLRVPECRIDLLDPCDVHYAIPALMRG
jgi:uncharacterized protein (DUF1501 family)